MKKWLLILVIPFMFASCKNLIPYSDAISKRNNWSDAEIKRIQFYTSDVIVLQRQITEGSTDIIQGKIKTVNGKKVDEIIIRAHTPGILVQMPKEQKMLISFEVDNDHYLSFGVNPNYGSKYTLLATKWDGRIGMVTYNNQEYKAAPGSADVFLMVDSRKILKEDINSRIAKGRKVD
jgi:hypothetical protein